MKYLLLSFLMSGLASASEWRFFEANHLSLDGGQIMNKRDPYTPFIDGGRYGQFHTVKEIDYIESGEQKENWRYMLRLNWNVDLIKYRGYGLFWDNGVRGLTTQKQFRTVDWQFKVGLDLGKVAIFREHMSYHVFDRVGRGGFPVEDYIVFRINFLD